MEGNQRLEVPPKAVTTMFGDPSSLWHPYVVTKLPGSHITDLQKP